MNIPEGKIFSENPESDLWRELLQFSYEANIRRFWEKRNTGVGVDTNTVDCITGSFLQAYEYYQSAKGANLQIAPLLLYYGSTNLLYGMANLLNGSILKIENHGMNILVPEQMTYIAETKVRFCSPNNGGIHVMARALGYPNDLTGYGDWKLSEFLDSIAEINDDYIRCYNVPCGKTVMLDVFHTPDGRVEKVYFTSENRDSIRDLLNEVENLKKSYLPFYPCESNSGDLEYYILRHKLNGKDISERSFSGQPYLRAAHKKNSKEVTLPTIINMYAALFILASLCRYHPEKWSPFVLKDTTGEKLLIEKFLYYARRMIPNIVLDYILDSKVQYVSDKYQPTDTVKFVGEHQVRDIVKEEIRERMEQERVTKYGRRGY